MSPSLWEPISCSEEVHGLIVNKKNGKIQHIINYQAGLPDDEISCITMDSSYGLWMSHFYGLTRADLKLPIKNFNIYPGLKGRLICMSYLDKTLYIGTNEGVFKLSKKAKKSIIIPLKKEERKIETPNTPKPQESVSKKESFFSRIFKKRKKTEEEVEEIKNITITSEIPQEEKPPIPPKKTISYHYPLNEYQFEQIKGINKKCKQLIIFNKTLLIITSDEIYMLKNEKVSSLCKVSVLCTLSDNNDDKIYIGTTEGIKIINKNFKVEDFLPNIREPVMSIVLTNDFLWAGLVNKILKVNKKEPLKYTSIPLKTKDRYQLRNIQKTPALIIGNEIYFIQHDTLQLNVRLSSLLKGNPKFYLSQDDIFWANIGKNWFEFSSFDSSKVTTLNWLNLFDNVNYIAKYDSIMWVIENYQNIYRVTQHELQSLNTSLNVFIKKLIGNNGKLFSIENVKLEPSENFLKLVVFSPYYLKTHTNQYAFYIENLMKTWSEWSESPEFNMTLPPGNWKIHVKAKNVFGAESKESVISIAIKKPFYQQGWFYALTVIIIILMIYLLVKWRVRYLEKEKIILEEKIRERTREIEEQKEEIQSQRDALAMQNILILEQKNKIALIHKDLTDSIQYAHHIQTSLLPEKNYLDKIFTQYYILYKPKDIVSGDFYWIKKIKDKIFLAVADCTGHGVPGAFLTMLGISYLNEILQSKAEMKAHEILNVLREKLVNSLLKENQEKQTQDGMDIAFCIIETHTNKLYFSGANSVAYLIRQGNIMELKGNKMPIGIHVKINESFTSSEYNIISGDELILFSDGYKDQIGGENEKRIKSSLFKQLLLEAYPYDLEEQKQHLEKFLLNWKGNYEQTDDILVLGIKL